MRQEQKVRRSRRMKAQILRSLVDSLAARTVFHVQPRSAPTRSSETPLLLLRRVAHSGFAFVRTAIRASAPWLLSSR
jgi:hypothetical protein